MNAVIAKIKNNPAVVGAFVAACLNAGALLGLHLDSGTTAGVVGIINVLAGFVIRSQVSPTNKKPTANVTPGTPTIPPAEAPDAGVPGVPGDPTAGLGG